MLTSEAKRVALVLGLPLLWFLLARFGGLGYFQPFNVHGLTVWPWRQWLVLVLVGGPWLAVVWRYLRGS